MEEMTKLKQLLMVFFVQLNKLVGEIKQIV